MIKFSIITVGLNAGQDLIDTVESTLNQGYENFEIIVKDGFSVDGSVEKLPQDERIKLVQKKDGGIYDAMNQGIDESSGDYLIFMNAGDLFYTNDVLSELASVITNSDADFYYGRCYNESKKVFSNAPGTLTPFFCYRSMICHQAMVISRKCFENGGYNTNFRVSADREFLMRIVLKMKLKTQYVPQIIARYEGGGFCETESSLNRIKNENKQLINTYFTESEQRKYRLKILLTFPAIRKRMVQNPKLMRIYKKTVGILYGNSYREDSGK